MFLRDVRKVDILFAHPNAKLCSKERSTELALLSAPTLRIALVPDDPRVLAAVAKAPALQELTISLHEDGPSAMESVRILLQNLSALRLPKLELLCCAPHESEFPFTKIERMNDGPHALAHYCPDLTAFETRRCSHGYPRTGQFGVLPAIHEVTLTAIPPDYVIPRLRGMPSVRIMDVRNGALLARRIGASVTHLQFSQDDRPISAREIAALSECERMSEMGLVLEEGSESSVWKAGACYVRSRLPESSLVPGEATE